MTLSWTPPTQLNGSELRGFMVIPDPDCPCSNVNVIDPNVHEVVISGLRIGTTYTFRVRATSNNGSGDLSDQSREVKPEPPTLRYMSWNLKRTLNDSETLAQADLESYAEAIDDSNADVVGLQEVTNDQAVNLAQMLGWPAPYYEPTKTPCLGTPLPIPLRCITFGNAILSRFPYTSTEKWLLPVAPTEGNENRKLLRTTFVVSGVQFHVYSTHLAANPGDEEEGGPEAREEQAQEIVRLVDLDRQMAEGQGFVFRPVVLGDFNSDPGDLAITAMLSTFADAWEEVHDGGGETSDPRANLTRRLDYVFVGRVGGQLPVALAIVPPTGTLSDHLPALAEL